MPNEGAESSAVTYRCEDCGDEFGGEKGNQSGYECFICGGQIRRVPDAE